MNQVLKSAPIYGTTILEPKVLSSRRGKYQDYGLLRRNIM
jgi:hypothetical protein